MSELPPVCSELQRLVVNSQKAVDETKAKIQQLTSQLQQLKSQIIQGNTAIVEEELLEIKLQLLQRERELGIRQTALNEAKRKFEVSGLKQCGNPNACEGESRLAQRIWTLSLPKQIKNTTILSAKATELTTQINNLTEKLKNCLYTNFDNNEKVVPFDFSIVNFANREAIATSLIGSECASNETKRKIIDILSDRKSFNPRGGGIKPSSARILNQINTDDRLKQEQELAQLLANEHPKQKELAITNETIQTYQNPDSEINTKLRQEFADKLKKLAEECVQEFSIKYTSSTVVTAAAGPGAPEGTMSVTKTLVNHGCITLNDTTCLFSLDTMKAIESLGPGGCDTNEKTTLPDGSIVNTGPYWIHPVNITSTITVSNVNELVTCVMDKFRAYISSKNSLEPVEGEGGAYWPTLTPNIPVTLTACVSAPK